MTVAAEEKLTQVLKRSRRRTIRTGLFAARRIQVLEPGRAPFTLRGRFLLVVGWDDKRTDLHAIRFRERELWIDAQCKRWIASSLIDVRITVDVRSGFVHEHLCVRPEKS